jgi:choline-sulfatase
MFARSFGPGTRHALGVALSGALLIGCGRGAAPAAVRASDAPPRPSILLVTLDTTRADAIGPEAQGVETPAFDALARRGRRFRQAYATVPETLPSHTSLMTGLYPAGHGVHENGRNLPAGVPVVAERLRAAGYRTAAFVSSFTLARRFGLARGFDLYDDELPAGRAERTSQETTDRTLALLTPDSSRPLFLWVHYYDAHYPYAPPEPFAHRYAKAPYLGEIAAMDEQLGRLVAAFEGRAGGRAAILIVGDHGEGLGEHGELQHGSLLYQATMHVPLLLLGPGVAPGTSDIPVSTRHVFHTLLDWAGLGDSNSLRDSSPEIVLGEAMKPFLEYGWQPQVMAVEGAHKAILAGRLEAYDVAGDPTETRDLAASAGLSRPLRTALRDYPAPSVGGARAPDRLDDDARRQLASLGYVGAGSAPVVRADAPRPADMTRLFDVLERASTLFVREDYGHALPLLEQILAADPHNLDATLRLATAHSALGQAKDAERAFEKAEALSPGSPDVRTYLALHYARGREWERAAPLLEAVVAAAPERLPAVEALAVIREREGRTEEAIALRRKAYALRAPSAAELVRLGELEMSAQQTAAALESFEQARRQQGPSFAHDLELGVLYLAAGRLPEAAEALDRVAATSPAYPMAAFKRAQVSVLRHEPDQAARIENARRRADATTGPLIAHERLFVR